MGKRVKVALMVIMLAMLLPVAGCVNPKPPAGAFPEKVGYSKRIGDVVSVREEGYIRHSGIYVDEGTRIEYELRIYPSAEQADAALEAISQKRDNQIERASWEDRLDGSGRKVGRLLLKYAINESGATNYCTLYYTQGSSLLRVSGQGSCELAKKFQQNLTS